MSKIAIDYRTQYEAAEARIRELEQREQQLETQRTIWMTRVEELEQRIARAREILEATLGSRSQKISGGDWQDVKRALAALEGK